MKNRAWLFLMPALLLVALSAVIPIMTVVNYSIHNLVPGSIAEFYGLGNFAEVLQDEFFMGAISRQFMFTFQVLLIQIPLGLFIATGYAFKLVVALLDTIPFYIGVSLLSRFLEIDPTQEHAADAEELVLDNPPPAEG